MSPCTPCSAFVSILSRQSSLPPPPYGWWWGKLAVPSAVQTAPEATAASATIVFRAKRPCVSNGSELCDSTVLCTFRHRLLRGEQPLEDGVRPRPWKPQACQRSSSTRSPSDHPSKGEHLRKGDEQRLVSSAFNAFHGVFNYGIARLIVLCSLCRMRGIVAANSPVRRDCSIRRLLDSEILRSFRYDFSSVTDISV